MASNERRTIYAVEQRMNKSGSRFSDIVAQFSGRNDSRKNANAIRDSMNDRQQKKNRWPYCKYVTVKYVPAPKG